MKRIEIIALAILTAIGMLLSGCYKKGGTPEESSVQNTMETYDKEENEESEGTDDAVANKETKENDARTESIESEKADDIEEVTNTSEAAPLEEPEVKSPELLNFVDILGENYQIEINQNVKKHSYITQNFQLNGQKMSYVEDERYSYRLGVDVSHHQGSIDWKKVKAAGYDFAFLRIGYRGYGQEGKIGLDSEFVNNIRNAKEAGMDVGVYFFAQAINEQEALEEAQFVLEHLAGEELPLPVVYDPEQILDAEARTDNVSGEQFTKNTIAFCETVKAAGYDPMVYCDMFWQASMLDLEQIAEYPIWYADYEAKPQTPYDFSFWQYTNKGQVDGIAGSVDLNIQLIEQ